MKVGSVIRIILKYIAFAALLCLILAACNQILIPKFYYWDTTPMSTFQSLYHAEENSVDVLIMGTSHAHSSVSPQVLYNEYGITSQNLATSMQPMIETYYWLEEALKTQKPKVVLLETYGFFDVGDGAILNTQDSFLRKGIDYMRFSETKDALIRDICAIDETQNLMSYYFTNMEYHTRWKEISVDDFSVNRLKRRERFRGYNPGYALMKAGGSFQPYVAGTSDEKTEFQEYMVPYIDRFVQLCEENGIELVLFRTPFNYCKVEEYNALEEYAELHGLKLIDFNEETVYNASGYDLPEDNGNAGHANLNGGEKITRYLGSVLAEESWYEKKTVDAYEKTKAYYDEVITAMRIPEEADLGQYLSNLKKDNYVIFIEACGLENDAIPVYAELLQERLGLDAEMMKLEEGYYTCVIEHGSAKERHEEETFLINGDFNDKDCFYQLSPESMVIRGTEKKLNQKGINIVVYDTSYDLIVDTMVIRADGMHR